MLTLWRLLNAEKEWREKRCLGQNVSLMVIDLIPWSGGKGGRRYYFFFLPISSSEHEKGIKKHISVLPCFAFLQFSALALVFLLLPPPSIHTNPREDLAKTAENLAWIKHFWVPLKRNKLTSDFSTHKAK